MEKNLVSVACWLISSDAITFVLLLSTFHLMMQIQAYVSKLVFCERFGPLTELLLTLNYTVSYNYKIVYG